ncbi:hypothetical protein RGU11_14690 [Rossellomorea marisflavi]|uniref:hypothetical protein n=1 Tax=Rossellomorea marisflavi TaxID=189381 RepID=UPI0028533B3A|nr:hypothetical protein [Rossellomorea marisflavi]MDR4937640.1 hypothetical protein [Rossellomorea marisflavi]
MMRVVKLIMELVLVAVGVGVMMTILSTERTRTEAPKAGREATRFPVTRFGMKVWMRKSRESSMER